MKLFSRLRRHKTAMATSINNDSEPLPTTSPGTPNLRSSGSDEAWRNRIIAQRPNPDATDREANALAASQHSFVKIPIKSKRSIFSCFTCCCKKQDESERIALMSPRK